MDKSTIDVEPDVSTTQREAGRPRRRAQLTGRFRLSSRLAATTVCILTIGSLMTTTSPAEATYNGKAMEARSWNVALVQRGSGSTKARTFCSGVLVARSKVLTAKHCVNRISAGNIRAVIGRTEMSRSTGQVRAVQAVHTHPSADLAVLTLTSPSTLKPLQIAPAALAGRWTPDNDIHLYGYGRQNGVAGTHGRLREVAFRINVHSNSATMVARWTGRSGCSGDSGGPVVRWHGGQPYLVGIWWGWSKVGGGQQPCNRSNNQQHIVMVGHRGTAANSPVHQWVRARI